MRKQSKGRTMARRVTVETSLSSGTGGGGNDYYRTQRQQSHCHPRARRQQREQQPLQQRPHSYIGFSRPDTYSSSVDFYSYKYSRGSNKNNSSNVSGRTGNRNQTSLRPNKSSNDVTSLEEAGEKTRVSSYRETCNESPSPSVYRDLINQTPTPSFATRPTPRDTPPYRSLSRTTSKRNPYSNLVTNRDSHSSLGFNREPGYSRNVYSSIGFNRDEDISNTDNLNSDTYNNNSSYTKKKDSTSKVKHNPYQIKNSSLNGSVHKDTKTNVKNANDLTSNKDKSRGSTGVTFDLPDEETSFQKDQTSVYGQFTISASVYRRMSTPELPPIVDSSTTKGGNNKTPRGDKRKTSTNSVNSNGSKTSINQLAAVVNSKTYYNRKASVSTSEGKITNSGTKNNVINRSKKKKLPIPRNHSDSSLRGLLANASSQSHGSGSTVNSYPTATADGGGNSSSGGVGSGSGSNAPRQIKYLSSGHRALSWCATDNSGSQTKLETLFEKQKKDETKGDGEEVRFTNSPLGVALTKTQSSNSINNMVSTSNFNNITDMPPLVSQRSVSVNGIRSREDISRLQALNQKLMSENGDTEVNTVNEFVSRGRMHRSNSENKLVGKTHQRSSSNTGNAKHHSRQTHRTMSRNLSVDRIDRLTSNSKPQRKNVASARPSNGANTRMRRVNSVSALNNNNNNVKNNALNDVSNQDDVFNDADSTEDDSNCRLVEWLNIVNSVDQYDTDPKDTVVEYTDEPPQTDTALHLVYGGE